MNSPEFPSHGRGGRVTLGVKEKFLENSRDRTGYQFIFVQVSYSLDYLRCGVETPHGGIFIQSMLQLLHSAPKQRMIWFEDSKTDMTDERQKMTQTQTNRQVNKHTNTQTRRHTQTHTHTHADTHTGAAVTSQRSFLRQGMRTSALILYYFVHCTLFIFIRISFQ